MTAPTTLVSFSEFGKPEVLRTELRPVGAPAFGEIQVRHHAIGVNYIDIYHRLGIFAAPLTLPSGLGVEGVGEITAVGEGVQNLQVGQRIAYVGGPPGSYASLRNVPAARVLRVPDFLSSTDIAAIIFKGLTAEYLTHRCVNIQAGQRVLVHAAAGGVGSIVCQWLSHMGVHVIGTVGSAHKAAVARANGCCDVINYSEEDFPSRVAAITNGAGVNVVFDSVGLQTFDGSLRCVSPRGTLVSFGESSGAVPPLNLSTLGARGSLFVTRPSIAHYTANRGEYEAAAARLFAAIEQRILQLPKVTSYALADAARAHADIEARRTTGSVILLPS